MSRNPMQGSQGKEAGESNGGIAGLTDACFDFEVVPSRRHQQAGKPRRAKRQASDEADRRRAVWGVTAL